MSDEEILERGGTQEDINRYAHDVGGACGLAYGWTCDYCTTTDNTQELDEILGKITGSLVDENIVPHDKYEDAVTDEDIVLLGQQLLDDAKQSILDWHNKQVEAVLDRLENENVSIYPNKDAAYVPLEFIEAERNKLKESSNDQL